MGQQGRVVPSIPYTERALVATSVFCVYVDDLEQATLHEPRFVFLRMKVHRELGPFVKGHQLAAVAVGGGPNGL
jgi:hypothetical protein